MEFARWACGEFQSLGARCRIGQLRMREAPVAGEAAAAGFDGNDDLVRAGAKRRGELRDQAELHDRADGVDGDARDASVDRKRGQKRVVGPKDGVDDPQRVEALPVGFGEGVSTGRKRVRARAGVDDDREPAGVAPKPGPLDRTIGGDRVGVFKPLG